MLTNLRNLVDIQQFEELNTKSKKNIQRARGVISSSFVSFIFCTSKRI